MNISDSVALEYIETRVCCCMISELQSSYGTQCYLLNGIGEDTLVMVSMIVSAIVALAMVSDCGGLPLLASI